VWPTRYGPQHSNSLRRNLETMFAKQFRRIVVHVRFVWQDLQLVNNWTRSNLLLLDRLAA
jgi:hypothetical protein